MVKIKRPLLHLTVPAIAVLLLNGAVNMGLLQGSGVPEPLGRLRVRLDEAAFVGVFLLLGVLFAAMYAVLRRERGYLYLSVFSALASLQMFADWDGKAYLFGPFPELPYLPLFIKCAMVVLVFAFAGYLFGTGGRQLNRVLLWGAFGLWVAVGFAWAGDALGLARDGLFGVLTVVFELEVFVLLGVNGTQFVALLRQTGAADVEAWERRYMLRAVLLFALLLLPDIGKDLLESLLERPIGYLDAYWEQCLEDTFAWALFVLLGQFGYLFFRRFLLALRENRRSSEELRIQNIALTRESQVRERLDRVLAAMGRTHRQEEWERVLQQEGEALFAPYRFRIEAVEEGRGAPEGEAAEAGDTVRGKVEAGVRAGGRAGAKAGLEAGAKAGGHAGAGAGVKAAARVPAVAPPPVALAPGEVEVQADRIRCGAGQTDGVHFALTLSAPAGVPSFGEREQFALQLMGRYAATFRDYFRLLETRAEELAAERERGQPWAAKLFLQLTEEERRRLASDLHDDVLQDIMHVRRLLEGRLEPSALEEARIGLENAEFTLRETCRELMPAFLLERGLTDAVGRLAATVRLRADFELELTLLPLASPVGEERTLALYRMVQELLTNAVKHSQARRVWLAVGQEGARLVVRYEDDGIGLALAPDTGLPATERLGFRGLAERARLLGGRLRADSAPGQGLRVEVAIPAAGRGAAPAAAEA